MTHSALYCVCTYCMNLIACAIDSLCDDFVWLRLTDSIDRKRDICVMSDDQKRHPKRIANRTHRRIQYAININ